MAKLDLKRLLLISAVTTIIVFLAAAGLWVYLRYFRMQTTGGPGTKIVSEAQLTSTPSEIFKMQGDLSLATRPLSDLLPDGWQKTERKIAVDKSKRILTLYIGNKPIKSYFFAIGPVKTGPKTRRDDGKTPEGEYYVCSKNPRSKYELSLLLSYPSTKDAENGLKKGFIDEETVKAVREAIEDKKTPPQSTPLGSAICIHGGGIGEVTADLKLARICDWTLGCIALRREDMVEVYHFAEPGTTVEINP